MNETSHSDLKVVAALGVLIAALVAAFLLLSGDERLLSGDERPQPATRDAGHRDLSRSEDARDHTRDGGRLADSGLVGEWSLNGLSADAPAELEAKRVGGAQLTLRADQRYEYAYPVYYGTFLAREFAVVESGDWVSTDDRLELRATAIETPGFAESERPKEVVLDPKPRQYDAEIVGPDEIRLIGKDEVVQSWQRVPPAPRR